MNTESSNKQDESRPLPADPSCCEELLPLVYQELRRVAARKLRREGSGQTLQTTALVHEAYLRLVTPQQQQSWDNRWHFFAAAAEAMRRILIERALRKQRIRHGGKAQRVELRDHDLIADAPSDRMLALNEALEKLERHDPAKAHLIKFRYFAGLTIEEAADLLRISRTVAHRQWAYARAWLRREMGRSEE
jgi:RNA polymerase sigma factor (TIGR02999 family)